MEEKTNENKSQNDGQIDKNQESQNTYTEKFKDLIEAKDLYNLLVQIKVLIRKEIRKNNYDEFCAIISFAVKEFSKHNEINSTNDIFNIFTTENEKFLKESDKKDNNTIASFLNTCKNCFNAIPMKNNEKVKMSHMQKFQILCDNYGIPHSSITDFQERFAVECIKNNEPITGYRLALKSGNISIIQMIYNDLILQNCNEDEKALSLARISFELLVLKNHSAAYKILAQNIDVRNFKNNATILNFSFFLIMYIEKNLGYLKFKELIYQYEVSLNLDPSFKKYMDKISLTYFNKKVFAEKMNFDILKMMKAMSQP